MQGKFLSLVPVWLLTAKNVSGYLHELYIKVHDFNTRQHTDLIELYLSVCLNIVALIRYLEINL